MGEIVTQIQTREKYIRLVQSNHLGIFIQFTASWCSPCKTIEPIINDFFKEMSRIGEFVAALRDILEARSRLCRRSIFTRTRAPCALLSPTTSKI